MIDAQLGPPVAVASRGGSAPAGAAANDFAATGSPADDGRFTAALESRRAPAHSDARPAEAQTPKDAAGPRTGELQEEDAAEAGASQEQTAAAGIAAAIAAAISIVVPTVASATPPSGDLAGRQVAEVAQAAPPQPIAGLVPARLDGAGGVKPVLTGAEAQALAATAATATGTPTGIATTPLVGMAAAVAPVTGQAAGPAAPVDGAAVADVTVSATAPVAPAAAATATLTLTIGTTPAQDPQAAATDEGSLPGAPASTAVLANDAKKGVAASPQAHGAPKAAVTATEPPAGTVAPPPAAQPTRADPLGGIVRSGGGLTTPHELAREIGSRVHMAVREGGRELVVNLRPADLGHLTIKVTMTDGVMQAQIIADRPESARMLQQSLGQLDSALGDLGYSLDNLDVAYQGQDPRDAQSASQQGASPARGEVLEADGSPAVSGPSTSTAAGSSSRLDLLA